MTHRFSPCFRYACTAFTQIIAFAIQKLVVFIYIQFSAEQPSHEKRCPKRQNHSFFASFRYACATLTQKITSGTQKHNVFIYLQLSAEQPSHEK